MARESSCKFCGVASFVSAALMSVGLACGMQAASQPSTKPATDESSPAPSKPKTTKPLVAKPHPLICEILYSVPKGEEGDADQNGSRSATGDEFIEIYNPHSTPIDLKGYVLSDAAALKGPESDTKRTTRSSPRKKGKSTGDSDATPGATPNATPDAPADGSNSKPPAKAKRSRLRFEFPALTLKPGETAVVFNGFESSAKGPISDGEIAPKRNENFANAYVFTMGTKSQFAALANDGDCVTLFAPDGRAIQCVRWGTASEDKKIDSAILMMEAPESKGSVTLDVEEGKFVEHDVVDTEAGSRFFSPGTFGASKNAKPPTKPTSKPTTKPATKPNAKPPTTASSPKDDQSPAAPK